MAEIRIVTFYKFVPIESARVAELKSWFEELAERDSVKGLIILGTEGINSTLAAEEAGMECFLEALAETPEFAELVTKRSASNFQPFRRFKVDVRDEIVTLGAPELLPEGCGVGESHLPPEEWDRVLREEEVKVIDVRNHYETRLGMFRGAIDPQTATFTEFPDWVRQSGLEKSEKILMYCTGGIRCEKAILEMKRQGFDNVYQLKGGILKYLEECPNREFVGECFVFDGRVALDQSLEPSTTYVFCPHCGDPAEVAISCRRCGAPGIVCSSCLEKDQALETCCKDCEYHFRREQRVSSAGA